MLFFFVRNFSEIVSKFDFYVQPFSSHLANFNEFFAKKLSKCNTISPEKNPCMY